MDQLTLRWYGHACFTVTCREFTVAFDPYEDNYVPGFAPLHLQADLVLCSHQHNDHNAVGLVKPITGHQNPFHIIEIPTFHDPEGGRLRGDNIIHVLEVGKLRIAHFGDIGCPLTPAQTAELQKIGVNINQIARRINSTGTVYAQDLEDIKGALAQIWQLQRSILSSQR